MTVSTASPNIRQTLTILLIALGSSTSTGSYGFFDELKLQQTPVTEPGTFDLLGVGACLALASRWRRQPR